MNQIEVSAGTIDYEDTRGLGPTLMLTGKLPPAMFAALPGSPPATLP